MRAVAYARVSKEEQAHGYSIEGQLETTRSHALKHGWEVVDTYVDPGYSARTDDRPAFKKMISEAKAGHMDVILVLRGDRFVRNRAHSAMYKQLLREVSVRVVSVTEPIEEGTPSGVMTGPLHSIMGIAVNP